MKPDIATFPTDASRPPGALARPIGERGFEPLALAGHSHVPASRSSR